MRGIFALILCALAVAASAQEDGLSTGFNTDGTPNGDDGVIAEEGIISPPDDFQELRLVDAPRARLRGLDTLNNTVDDFMISVGETLIFKRLEVTLEACRYPEGNIGDLAYAYLRIRDRREEDARFDGWMLSESPALSALDHPRYDIWVLSCSTA
ncbi:DUF2155 domain-containing protein [Algicella marina]|uniref:DUF2155 domain-containing protein n=1 Tax=Algicella marina TaxID=2683284 RepID=A0A6P1SZP5_9RHOB|nr:DUF2155 domain-containing protein [Algicella marina]QHQ34686.1 DUF2155 domain-containing protein [Algicella marina]